MKENIEIEGKQNLSSLEDEKEKEKWKKYEELYEGDTRFDKKCVLMSNNLEKDLKDIISNTENKDLKNIEQITTRSLNKKDSPFILYYYATPMKRFFDKIKKFLKIKVKEDELICHPTIFKIRSLMARVEIKDVLKKIEYYNQEVDKLKKELSKFETELTILNKQKDTFIKFINEGNKNV